MSTKARDYYRDLHDFRQMCGDAQSQARSESEQEFAAQMAINASKFGLETYVSPKQLQWLCRIADHEVPERIQG